MEDIISTESRMFKVLSFSVSLILAYDILTILIENFVSKNLEEENLIKELWLKSLYFLKLAIHFVDFIDLGAKELAVLCIYAGFMVL